MSCVLSITERPQSTIRHDQPNHRLLQILISTEALSFRRRLVRHSTNDSQSGFSVLQASYGVRRGSLVDLSSFGEVVINSQFNILYIQSFSVLNSVC